MKDETSQHKNPSRVPDLTLLKWVILLEDGKSKQKDCKAGGQIRQSGQQNWDDNFYAYLLRNQFFKESNLN